MQIYPVTGSWSQHLEAAAAFRHQLHRHPELTWQEHATAATIRDSLTALGLPWQEYAGTGTLARVDPPTGQQLAGAPHIALRADIDALPIHELTAVEWRSEVPGCMHACGHDGHTAALMLAASWLSQHQSDLQAPVSLLFQPAEEGGHGAKAMLDAGALAGVDEIYGWHNWPALPAGTAVCPDGPVMSANATFRITVNGTGGHSSQPEIARDPILAGAAIVVALQQLVSRRLPPQTPAVVSVTSFAAPSAPTVIPDSAQLEGSIRVADTLWRERIGGLIAEIAGAAAQAHNTTANVEFFPRYGATVNHPAQAARARSALARVLGSNWHSEAVHLPLMASEDFSYYLEHIPGAFMLIGSSEGDRYRAACHNPQYEFNDKLIDTAARTMLSLLPGVDK